MTIPNVMRAICSRRSCGMLLGGMLLLAQAASAENWTGVASAFVPDEESTGLYDFDDGTVKLKSTAPLSTTIKLRCNVPSPTDSTTYDWPTWNTLKVGYYDPDGGGGNYKVTARLVSVTKSTGAVSVLATFNSNAVGPTLGSVGFIHKFDYITNAYYVVIDLYRLSGGSTAYTPKVWFVGLD